MGRFTRVCLILHLLKESELLPVGAIMNKATVNHHRQGLRGHVFFSLGQMPKSVQVDPELTGKDLAAEYLYGDGHAEVSSM